MFEDEQHGQRPSGTVNKGDVFVLLTDPGSSHGDAPLRVGDRCRVVHGNAGNEFGSKWEVRTEDGRTRASLYECDLLDEARWRREAPAQQTATEPAGV